MVNPLFALRIWLAFICAINFAITASFYAWLLPRTNRYLEPLNGDNVEYFWGDYFTIIASISLLLSYLFSVFGKSFSFISPRIRAALMTTPALFIFGNQIRYMLVKIKHADALNRDSQGATHVDYFSCFGIDGPECPVMQGYTFFPIVVSLFVLIEVIVTLVRGPLLPLSPTKELKDIEDNSILLTDKK
ncbi:MAG: hypothetical protein J3R72DRAFT_429128 [Linnemannia gamsii]|nr:MAG: hypothetical protein J3R72DRAFT_429128 [Linnemannia gamsii]